MIFNHVRDLFTKPRKFHQVRERQFRDAAKRLAQRTMCARVYRGSMLVSIAPEDGGRPENIADVDDMIWQFGLSTLRLRLQRAMMILAII